MSIFIGYYSILMLTANKRSNFTITILFHIYLTCNNINVFIYDIFDKIKKLTPQTKYVVLNVYNVIGLEGLMGRLTYVSVMFNWCNKQFLEEYKLQRVSLIRG